LTLTLIVLFYRISSIWNSWASNALLSIQKISSWYITIACQSYGDPNISFFAQTGIIESRKFSIWNIFTGKTFLV